MMAQSEAALDLKLVAQSSPAGLGFAMGYNPDTGRSSFYVPPHIDLLNETILDLVTGEPARDGFRRVWLSMPPRHGKSETVSHYLPAWYLGRWPQKHVAL